MNFDLIADQSRASIEHDDLKVLLPLVAKIQPKNILEIGTWKGYSAETWIKSFSPQIFITLEIDPKPEDAIEIEGYDYRWKTNSHPESKEIGVIPAIPLPFKAVKEGIDFLFIDGDHSEAGVCLDFQMYSPLVRKGGIIVFHDVVYTSPDPLYPVMVKPLWDKLKLTYPYVEIKAGKNSTGIGVIYV